MSLPPPPPSGLPPPSPILFKTAILISLASGSVRFQTSDNDQITLTLPTARYYLPNRRAAGSRNKLLQHTIGSLNCSYAVLTTMQQHASSSPQLQCRSIEAAVRERAKQYRSGRSSSTSTSGQGLAKQNFGLSNKTVRATIVIVGYS